MYGDLVARGVRGVVLEVRAAAGDTSGADEAQMLRVDAGRTVGFARVTARKP